MVMRLVLCLALAVGALAPTPLAAQPPAPEGTKARWFGHAFIYLVSKSGVRIAINPFTEGTVDYPLPQRLPADIVLISSEAPDYSGGQHIFGLPQVFRSLTGVGANRANGIPFRGINTWRDSEGGKRLGRNTVYQLEVDGLRYVHLGTLGHVLSAKDVIAIGRADVLFLPVGTRELSEREILRNAELLQAKWIVPLAYGTHASRRLGLRPLEDMDFGPLPVQKTDAAEFVFTKATLPATPTVLKLKEPPGL
jgi:L-ascorbate metabolism protein UlaG (beta-lactamase superfamily)